MKARRMETDSLPAGRGDSLFPLVLHRRWQAGQKMPRICRWQDFPWLWQMWIWKRRTDSARILNRRQRKLPENRRRPNRRWRNFMPGQALYRLMIMSMSEAEPRKTVRSWGEWKNHAVAQVEGEENGWYRITSGSISGYIRGDFPDGWGPGTD